MISAVTSVVGNRWLIIEFRPNVASTAENARSTGMPAATAAPNAKSRMMSVSGSDTFRAWFRSPSILFERTWSADACPNSAMCISGCAFWRSAAAFMTGWMRFLAVSIGPVMSNCTSTERPSFVTWPALLEASGLRTLVTCGNVETRSTVWLTTARKLGSSTVWPGSVMMIISPARSLNPASSMTRAA